MTIVTFSLWFVRAYAAHNLTGLLTCVVRAVCMVSLPPSVLIMLLMLFIHGDSGMCGTERVSAATCGGDLNGIVSQWRRDIK